MSEKERTPIKQDIAEPELTPKGRKARVPLGVVRMKLNASKREGYHRHWINDSPGRLDSALDGGYVFVEETDNVRVGQGQDLTQREGLDSRVSRVVGTARDGSALRAYLMEIPQDMYDEDQKAKASQLALTEKELKRAEHGKKNAGQDGNFIYAPAGNKFEDKVGR
jgi:hypothetical protein